MDFALVYLVQRFFYRIFDFFRHWYVDGSKAIGHRFIGALEDVDRSFAIEITLRHFFEPLYKDYTVIGRILGVIFRTARIIVGLVVYVIVAVIFLIIYLIWILIPPAILFYGARTI